MRKKKQRSNLKPYLHQIIVLKGTYIKEDKEKHQYLFKNLKIIGIDEKVDHLNVKLNIKPTHKKYYLIGLVIKYNAPNKENGCDYGLNLVWIIPAFD